MATTDIQDSFAPVLNSIRSSNLNYSLQETPFSFYLTLRKSFIQPSRLPASATQLQALKLPESSPNLQIENELLSRKCNTLEREYQTLKDCFEEATLEIEANNSTTNDLKTRLENLHSKLETSEKIIVEKSDMENKLKAVYSDNIKVKEENTELKKEISILRPELKLSRKDKKDLEKRLEKSNHSYEKKLKDLLDFKATKIEEERELKSKIKKLEKKQKI